MQVRIAGQKSGSEMQVENAGRKCISEMRVENLGQNACMRCRGAINEAGDGYKGLCIVTRVNSFLV